MSKRRHSAIQFNPTEWLAGTARMPRIVRSVYFDLCLYTWETANPVPQSEEFLMISDLPEGQGEAIVNSLIQSGKLVRGADGSIHSPEALTEAMRAYAVWEAKSRGGRGGAPAPVEEPQQAPEAPREPDVVTEAGTEFYAAQIAENLGQWDVKGTIDRMAEAVGAPEIAAAWNKLAARSGLKQIKKMTAERIGRLNERIAEHGAEAIVAAIGRMAGNQLVLSTKPTFDAILNPETCAKMVSAEADTDEEACG